MMEFRYIDDGQGQGTFVVIDEWGSHVSNIGLPLTVAIHLTAAYNAGLLCPY